MELIAIMIVGFLALWMLLSGNNRDVPPEGYAPVEPGTDNVTQASVCSAYRTRVATSTDYDVDSYVVERRQDARPLLPPNVGIRVDDWPTTGKRQRQKVRR